MPAAMNGALVGLRFEEVFADRGEPASLHYDAHYVTHGQKHQLSVWRHGDRGLVRRTDTAIETHVTRQPGDPAYEMTVLDLQRKIATHITRDDLYRIGSFTDWFDLAHGLRHPAAGYRLVSAGMPAGAPQPLEQCGWYALEQVGHTTHICWSTRNRIPLLMLSEDGQVVWQVVELSRGALSATVFDLHDEGYIRNDARQDISGD